MNDDFMTVKEGEKQAKILLIVFFGVVAFILIVCAILIL